MTKILVLSVLFVQYLWEQFLQFINIKFITENIKKYPGALPEILVSEISLEDYKKAADYSKAKVKFGAFAAAFNFALVVIIILFSLLNIADKLVEGLPGERIIFCLIIFFIAQIIGIPFRIYSTFVIEERFGFNKMTAKTFVIDLAKGIVVSLVLLIPLLGLLFYFYDVTGKYWWAFGFLLFAAFQY